MWNKIYVSLPSCRIKKKNICICCVVSFYHLVDPCNVLFFILTSQIKKNSVHLHASPINANHIVIHGRFWRNIHLTLGDMNIFHISKRIICTSPWCYFFFVCRELQYSLHIALYLNNSKLSKKYILQIY